MGIASFPAAEIIGNWALRRCTRLMSLYLLGPSVCQLSQGAFDSTPIGGYLNDTGAYGSVFVPASLYDAYLSAENWSYYAARLVSVEG